MDYQADSKGFFQLVLNCCSYFSYFYSETDLKPYSKMSDFHIAREAHQ